MVCVRGFSAFLGFDVRCGSVSEVLGVSVAPFNAICGGVDAVTGTSPFFSYPVHMYEPVWLGDAVRPGQCRSGRGRRR